MEQSIFTWRFRDRGSLKKSKSSLLKFLTFNVTVHAACPSPYLRQLFRVHFRKILQSRYGIKFLDDAVKVKKWSGKSFSHHIISGTLEFDVDIFVLKYSWVNNGVKKSHFCMRRNKFSDIFLRIKFHQLFKSL